MTGLGGVLTATGHVGHHPTWDCERCGDPWPCPVLRRIPRGQLDPAAWTPAVSAILRRAIADLRGQGPEPPEIVQRFLWFLPLTDEEARAIARRMR